VILNFRSYPRATFAISLRSPDSIIAYLARNSTAGARLGESLLWSCTSGHSGRFHSPLRGQIAVLDVKDRLCRVETEAGLKCGTYYYAYSCCPAHGESEYFCLCIESTCGHRHATPTEAAACVKNPCTGYVRAVSWGRDRALRKAEIAKVQRAFNLRPWSTGNADSYQLTSCWSAYVSSKD
jgi:hypothetical protein